MTAPLFQIGQKVLYRTKKAGHGYEAFTFAIVRKINAERITIEIEVQGEKFLRPVKADRLKPA